MRLVRVLGPVLGWSVAYLVAAHLGRATVADTGQVGLLWPAAGVAALWMAARWRTAWWALDVVALAAATWSASVTTGAPADLAAIFVVVNVLQPCLLGVLVRRLGLDVHGLGGTMPFCRVDQLVTLCVAVATACLVGATLGTAGLVVTGGDGSWSALLAWWGRHTVGMLVVVGVWLVLLPLVSAVRGGVANAERRTPSRRETLDAVVVVVLTVMIGTVVMTQAGRPLAFVLLFTTVIAAVRTGPVFTALHALVTGVVVVVFTLLGHGPFAQIQSPLLQAGIAQLFVALTLVTGLALAFHRSERDAALLTLGAERRDAADRAALLEAVLATCRRGSRSSTPRARR